MRTVFVTIFIMGLGCRLAAQVLFPEAGPVFRDDLLPVVKLWLPPDSLAALYANPESDHEFPVTFSFESGDVLDFRYLVGLRFRGNTSRSSAKKSFKLSFNTFVDKRDYYGLEKMNLNGEHNDPCVIRSKLYWDLCREFGIPAPRANHILLYINDIFEGVYINVEQIDEEFTGLRFGTKNGNLYKCLWPADLTFRGNNPDDYKFTSGSRRTYELKTNEDADDYTGLAVLIDKLNNTPYHLLPQEIEKVINVPVLLRMIAMDVFTGNWDGPFYNKNNFYLYDNPLTGKFEIMPYDVDNTFGIDWFNVDWARRDVYSWSYVNEPRPLYTRILAVSAYRKEFTRLFYELLDLASTQDHLVQHALTLRDLYATSLAQDPLYPRDHGWNSYFFYQSFNESLSASHVKYGLIPYINTRIETARQQLDDISGTEEFSADQAIRIYPNPASDKLVIQHDPRGGSLLLLNLQGQMVSSTDLSHSSETSVDVSRLPEGLYLLRIIRDIRNPIPETFKVMISH
ncbi:MAG: CotH kinase family protein [Bacteroidota bacterium]